MLPEAGGTPSIPGDGAGVGVSKRWFPRVSGRAIRPDRDAGVGMAPLAGRIVASGSPSLISVSARSARISHGWLGSVGMTRATGFVQRGHFARQRPGLGSFTVIRCWQYGHTAATAIPQQRKLPETATMGSWQEGDGNRYLRVDHNFADV